MDDFGFNRKRQTTSPSLSDIARSPALGPHSRTSTPTRRPKGKQSVGFWDAESSPAPPSVGDDMELLPPPVRRDMPGEEGADMTKDREDEEVDEEEDADESQLPQAGSLEDKAAVAALLETFTPEQQNRYETFRRAALGKGAVKKIIQGFLGQSVPNTGDVIIAGCGKLFVGEMTERAREVMTEWGDTGPIRPDHLREAFRRYKEDTGTMKSSVFKKRRFS
ncbi:hypothetical protein HK104_000143 [Borealophlyctis nickersoniae]|nr:hypothetical protein HK104_000143 [Borealophlyctis nickersoniae]